jgi:hypothetical protein
MNKNSLLAHRRQMYRRAVRLFRTGRVPEEYVEERCQKLDQVTAKRQPR